MAKLTREFSAMIAFVSATLLLTSLMLLPVGKAYSQATQWSWDTAIHTNCDGFTISNIRHSGNTIAGFLSMPVMKVFYPDPGGTVLVDQPGLTGCTQQQNAPSYTQHFPQNHDFAAAQDYSYTHAIWFVGGGCSEFMLIPGCYKYEQRIYFWNAEGGVDPKFRTAYRLWGPGFYADLGYPQYHAYFRVNVDVGGSGSDYSQRRLSDGTWQPVQSEDGYFAEYAALSGTQFRVYDTSTTAQRLDVYAPSIDNGPFVTILRWVSSEFDPTDNSPANQYLEPIRWKNSGTSVNGQDIVLWYETYSTASSSQCNPTNPCIIGPSFILRGGL